MSQQKSANNLNAAVEKYRNLREPEPRKKRDLIWNKCNLRCTRGGA